MQKPIRKAKLIIFLLIFTLTFMGTASAADTLSDNSVTCVNHVPITHGLHKVKDLVIKKYNPSISNIKSSDTPLNHQTHSTTVTPTAQVSMAKTSNGPIYVGQKGTFIVTLINNGPNDATNVKVKDPYIQGFIYKPSTGSYNFNTGIWTISRLGNGVKATLTITKVISRNDVGKIDNTASETQDTFNPSPITPQTASLIVNPVANVTMVNTCNGPVYVGQIGKFTIRITNNGPNDAKNVLVSDSYMPGFRYIPSIGTYDASAGMWIIGTLANGETATLTVSKVMTATEVGLYVNTATETQDTYNPSQILPQVAGLIINPVAQVTLSKTSNGPVHAGQTGTFTVTVTNNGPNDAKRVVVIDHFMSGFTYTPSIGTYDSDNGLWTIGTLANGETATLTISRIMKESDVGTTIYNTAHESQQTYNPLPVTPQTAGLTIKETAHVIMVKTSNGPVYAGQIGSFVINVMNKGPNDAVNISVSDLYIPGFVYKPSIGWYNPRTGIWTIPKLANGATATLIMTKVMSGKDVGTIQNTATETQETYNPTPVKPETAILTVKSAAHVTMTVSTSGPVNIGQRGTFILKVTNKGPNNVQNVRVTDAIPTGFTIGGCSLGTYDGKVWTIPSLACCSSATLIFNKVMTAADGGTTITNTASETQETYNPKPITSQTGTIYVNNLVLSINKTSEKRKYNAGDSVVYDIDVKNNGPDTAKNLIVTDTLQSGLIYVSSSLGGSYNALTRTITWKLASLDSGVHFTPSIKATVNSGTQGRTITNTASAYNDDIKIPTTSTPVNIMVNKAVLSIRKVSDKTKYNVGDTVHYTITVKNNGPETATNMVVTDTLPAGMTFVNCTRGGVWDSVRRTITWNVADLISGSYFRAAVTARIKAQSGKTLINRVQAKDDQYVNPVSTSSSLHVKKCRLYVNVSPARINASVGKTFTITYKVGNRGPDVANNVVMTFVIPAGLKCVSAVSQVSARPIYSNAKKTVTWILGDVKVGDPTIKLNIKALRAGTFLISSTLISSTTSRPQVIRSAVTVKATNKNNKRKIIKPIRKTTTKYKSVHTYKTLHGYKTGTPIGALILAVLMVLGGIILPKMKN